MFRTKLGHPIGAGLATLGALIAVTAWSPAIAQADCSADPNASNSCAAECVDLVLITTDAYPTFQTCTEYWDWLATQGGGGGGGGGGSNPPTQAPTITAGPADGSTVGPTGSKFTFSSSEAGVSGYQCQVDQGSWTACTSPYDLTSLTAGQHRFAVEAVNGNGAGPASPTISWTITAPVVISEGPSGLVGQSSATFGFASVDSGGSFQCRVDGSGDSGFARCSSPDSYTGLRDGSHTFFVREVDGSGTPGVITHQSWTIDTTLPVTTIKGGPSGRSDSTDAIFSFSSSKPGSTFSCVLDGASEPCDSPQTYTNLSLGPHSFRVVATDALGHVDKAGAGRSFRVFQPSNLCPAAAGDGAQPAGCGHSVSCPKNERAEPPPAGPFVFVATRSTGCFHEDHGAWMTNGPLQVNGIPISLPGGVELTVGKRRVSADRAVLDLGALGTVTVGVNWRVPDANTVSAPLAGKNSLGRAFSGGRALPLLSGLNVRANANLVFQHSSGGFDQGHDGSTKLSVSVTLPTALARGGKGKKKAKLMVGGDLILANQAEPDVQLHASIPKVRVFKLFELSHLNVDYDTAERKLSAHGELGLSGGRSVIMDVAFARGRLSSYSVAVEPNLPVSPTLCLTKVSIAQQLADGQEPASLGAGGGFSFGLPTAVGCGLEPIRIDGSLTLKYPSTPAAPSEIDLQGTGSLYSLHVASLKASWDVPTETLQMSGDLQLNLLVASGSLTLDKGSRYQITTGKLNILASAKLAMSIPGLPRKLSGTVHVNNTGLVACASNGLGFSLPWDGGIAAFHPYLKDCKLDALGQ